MRPSYWARSLFALPNGVFLLRLSVLCSQVTVVGWDFRQVHVPMSFEKGAELLPILRPTRHSTCSNSLLAIIGRRLRGGLQPTNWIWSLAHQLPSAVEETPIWQVKTIFTKHTLPATVSSLQLTKLSWVIPVKSPNAFSCLLCMLHIRPSPTFFVCPQRKVTRTWLVHSLYVCADPSVRAV
jgi:hypothetical protein